MWPVVKEGMKKRRMVSSREWGKEFGGVGSDVGSESVRMEMEAAREQRAGSDATRAA